MGKKSIKNGKGQTMNGIFSFILIVKNAPSKFRGGIKLVLLFLCGKEQDGRINRSAVWTMISTVSTIVLLLVAYIQIHQVNETTSADFSNRFKNDLYTSENLQIISLFDDEVLVFKTSTDNYAWFELDSLSYKELPNVDQKTPVACKYDIFKIDQLLQNFEDLSFYEAQGQIRLEYIYDAYAFYIEMLWENKEMKKYIKWERSQPHNGNSYINLENIYNRLKLMTDEEK
jgi:hypothetical protein